MPIIKIFAIGGNWIDDAAAYQPPMVGDTFLVSTGNQLAWVSYMVQNGSTFTGKTVELQNNIDLAGKEWSPIGGWNGTQTDTSKCFYGTFDGKGYKISNMKIDLPNRNHIGLFGYVRAVIKNVGVIDVDVKGQSSTGGLVGNGSGSTITNCYATGSVTGYDIVGGLVGFSSGTEITNCYATGNVTGTRSGGGISIPGTPIGVDPIISNCYATGSVTGNYIVGGLVGYMGSYTIIAYWNTDTQQKTVGNGTSSTDSKLTGLTTDEMKSPAFVDMLNDHINIAWAAWKYDVNNENDGYPILDYAKGIPNPDKFWIANAQQPNIVGNTYEIRTAEQLAWIAKETNSGNNFSGKTVKLINNIDLQGKDWTPIGITDYAYKGTFDGNNKKIQNLRSGKLIITGHLILHIHIMGYWGM